MLETKYHTKYQYACNHGGFIDCKYNKRINCVSGSDCQKCGWNPAVSEKRKGQLKNFYTNYFKFIKLERKDDSDE